MKRLSRNVAAILALLCLVSIGAFSWPEADAATIAYQQAVLANSPVAFWRFNETSGTTANDSSGNGHNGTYTNGPVLGVTGVGNFPDNAAQFDGIDHYVVVPDDPGFNLTNFTLEAWIKLISPTGANLRIASQQDGSNYYLLHLFQVAPGDYRLTYYGSLDGISNVQRGPNLNDGSFHHVAITRDTVSDLVTWYVDGAAQGTPVVTLSNATYTIADNVYLGAFSPGTSQNFPGIIDEVAITNSALTAAVILQHYQTGLFTPPVPEPSTWVLLGLGTLALAWRRARGRKN